MNQDRMDEMFDQILARLDNGDMERVEALRTKLYDINRVASEHLSDLMDNMQKHAVEPAEPDLRTLLLSSYREKTDAVDQIVARLNKQKEPGP